MTIREYTGYTEEEILGLYAAVGWTAYTDDPEALLPFVRKQIAEFVQDAPQFDDITMLGLVYQGMDANWDDGEDDDTVLRY